MLKFLTLCAHLLLVGNDAKALRAIEGCVDYLSLEREALDLGHIDIFHFKQHVKRLQPIFEGKDTVDGHIAELASQERFVLGEVLGELVTELEALVQFDFRLNLGCDDRFGEHAGEVLGQSGRVHPFYVAACEICEFAQGVDVALVTLD